MLNSAIIMGRLTATPELRTTASGASVTSFTVAVERSYAKPGEERQTDFINVVAWRGTADNIARFFQKGQMIAIQGSIQTRNYEDKNGNKRQAVEVVADSFSFCGSKSETTPANSFAQPQVAAPVSYQSEDAGSFSILPTYEDVSPFDAANSDDVPF